MRRSDFGAVDTGSSLIGCESLVTVVPKAPRRLQTGRRATSGFLTRRLGGPRAKPSVETFVHHDSGVKTAFGCPPEPKAFTPATETHLCHTRAVTSTTLLLSIK
jgi:hypothetical protein